MKRLCLTAVMAFLISLAVLLTASVACASITITGTNVQLLTGSNRSALDTTQNSGSVTRTQSSSGTLARFNTTLGVLTNAGATLTLPLPLNGTTAVGLGQAGSGGSSNVSYSWSLGGNSASRSVQRTSSGLTTIWPAINLTSSATNLNNFVGVGNIVANTFSTTLSAYRSGASLSGTSAFIGTSQTGGVTDLIANESITYDYVTHSNASFDSGGDVNGLTIDFGLLANGTSHNENFSIFNSGGLGLTSFTLSFLGGDNLFNITGGNVTAGGSSLYNASFAGQNPLALTDYEGTYRLTFTDDVSGLSQFASDSVGTNYIDLTMRASVAPEAAAVPEPATIIIWSLLGGFGLVFAWRKRKTS